jgi:pimeloyl-ACP methyl ester carboxylesterase
MVMTVPSAGVELAVTQSGDGPAVLLIHGIASDAAAFGGIGGALADRTRLIAYDRRGYGASTAPVPYEATTVEEQAEDAAAVLAAAHAGPAVVVGDGLGALVALDLLKRHRARCAAAVLIDPPLFAFVPQAIDHLSATQALLGDHLREGGPQAAVAAWLGDRVDDAEIERAQAAHRAFFADLAGLSSWPVTRRELRAMAVPIVVLTGPSSSPHVVAAADAVAALLPTAQRRTDGDVVGATDALLAP